jgi:hypothetical protein
MTKAVAKPDSRAKALAGMTKAELVKTIKSLDKRQTTLLNKLADLGAKLLWPHSQPGVVWLRDVDGTGSMHPCAEGDDGAVAYTPVLPPEDDAAKPYLDDRPVTERPLTGTAGEPGSQVFPWTEQK